MRSSSRGSRTQWCVPTRSSFPPTLSRAQPSFCCRVTRRWPRSLSMQCKCVWTSCKLLEMCAISPPASFLSFDLIAAVGYPIAVLVYSYVNFDFDAAAFQVNIDVLPTGSFELLARAAADPAEIAFFLACFDSLRFLTLGNLALRLCLNLSFCNRFRGVVATLLRQQRLMTRVKQNAVATTGPLRLALSTPEAITSASSAATSAPTPQPQRPVPRMAAAVFVAYAALVVAVCETAMADSLASCSGYPQCVVFAHRLQSNGSSSCPCLTLIDVDRHPRTYEEWMHPVDDTDVVTELASSGDLRVLQLINHGLPRWPDALRGCQQLHYMYVHRAVC
jgi:hypothetical protein